MATTTQKQQRLSRQQAELETINALASTEEQGRLLFQTWPQRVPMVVWKALRRAQKREWLRHRSLLLRSLDGDADVYMYQDVAQVCLETYEDDVAQVVQLLRSLPGRKKLIVGFTNPMLEEDDLVYLSYHMNGPDLVRSGSISLPLSEALALAFNEYGTVTIHQEQMLKVQRPDEQGVMKWVPQERVYGLSMDGGHWHPGSKAEVKQNYNTDDQTGQPLPLLSGISFGDLREVAQSMVRSTN